MNVTEEVDFDFFETPRNDSDRQGKQNLESQQKSRNSESEKNGGMSNGSYSPDRNVSNSRNSKENKKSRRRRSYSSSSSDSDTDSETPRRERESSKSRPRKDNSKDKKYRSDSDTESSSAYSNSDFSSEESESDDRYSNKEKIDIRMPNPQNAWESESKPVKRSEKKHGQKYLSASSDSESETERERNEKRSKGYKEKNSKKSSSSKNKQKSLRSRSSSYSNNSDITDVSPLESAEESPRYSRKQYNDNNRERHVQYDSPERDANINLETDQIDLSILMKCMADIDKEKQQRIKTNSRRVAFASTSSMGDKQKGNYTFTVGRAKIIEKENQRLLKQIMMQMNGGGTKKIAGVEATRKGPKRATQPVVQRLTPSAVNRMKEQRRIENENMQMLGRLRTVRPTRGMSREEQIDDAERILSYGLPSGTMMMPGDTYYEPKPYRVTHSSMSHTMGSSQRSRPSSAKSNASMVVPGRRSRPSSAKSNASMVSNASMRSNVSKRSVRSNASSVGVRKMADGRVDRRPAWDDRFSFA